MQLAKLSIALTALFLFVIGVSLWPDCWLCGAFSGRGATRLRTMDDGVRHPVCRHCAKTIDTGIRARNLMRNINRKERG